MPATSPLQLPETPTPFIAERMSGPDGVVEWWGDELTEGEAIARLKSGKDVVVRGQSRRENRELAKRLADGAFGGHEEDAPHQGKMALPHFHPIGRTIEVHIFFDAPPAPYARRRKPPKPKKGTK